MNCRFTCLFLLRQRSSFVAAVMLGLLAMRFAATKAGLVADPWSYRCFPLELPLFLAGSLGYRFYRGQRHRAWMSPRIGRTVFVLVLAAIAGYAAVPSIVEMVPKLWMLHPYLNLRPICLGFALALPWIFAATRNWRWDRAVGELSYPLYIGHMLVVWVVPGMMPEALAPLHSLAVCVVSLGLAVVLHVGLQRRIDRWRGGWKDAAVAPAPLARLGPTRLAA